MRFLRGHNTRKEPYPDSLYVEEDCGYDTPCWIWQLKLDKDGYGKLERNGKTLSAHRMYYEERFGELPGGMVPDHLCRVRSCVNPDHMRPLTLEDNSRYKSSTKMNPDKVAEIRKIAAAGVSQYEIAQQFGISQGHVHRIVRRKAWAD